MRSMDRSTQTNKRRNEMLHDNTQSHTENHLNVSFISPVCSVLPASIKLPSPLACTMANAGQINRTRTICAGCHCLIPFRPPIPESATTSDRPDNISWHYSTRKRIRRVSYQNAFGVGMLAWAPGRERGRDTEAQTHIHTAPIRSQIYGKFARRTHIMVMQRLNEYSQSGLCVCVCACVECKSGVSSVCLRWRLACYGLASGLTHKVHLRF